MDEWTLKGKRKEVYALLKILKYAMDSDAKSYDAKYSVEMIFQNKEPSDMYGNALEEVLKHKNIRGHFNGSNVHPDQQNLRLYSKPMRLTFKVNSAIFLYLLN